MKAFLLCLLIGGSGVGYVWQKDQISQLGKQITKRERQRAVLADQSEKLRRQLGTMRSPDYLQKRIQELGLGLVPPQPAQVWRLSEPARDLPVQQGERQYAAPRAMGTEPKG